ncbi:hypothetical protein [Catelliglobosispora koreensis]|uniref:hypothetical protein n=1 Tax=Catelliglobosispora koreensis TaxID=129052 RepID=UPI00036A6CEF|nr:hypothetical protein [Catelliglobosispora koreensis]
MTLVGPFIAIALIMAVAALMHRTLRRKTLLPVASPSLSPPPTPVRPTQLTDNLTDDYGLLATAAVCRTQADALLVKEHLRTAGIRSTLATAPDGQIRVLVFGDEVVRARRLVG